MNVIGLIFCCENSLTYRNCSIKSKGIGVMLGKYILMEFHLRDKVIMELWTTTTAVGASDCLVYRWTVTETGYVSLPLSGADLVCVLILRLRPEQYRDNPEQINKFIYH